MIIAVSQAQGADRLLETDKSGNQRGRYGGRWTTSVWPEDPGRLSDTESVGQIGVNGAGSVRPHNRSDKVGKMQAAGQDGADRMRQDQARQADLHHPRSSGEARERRSLGEPECGRPQYHDLVR